MCEWYTLVVIQNSKRARGNFKNGGLAHAAVCHQPITLSNLSNGRRSKTHQPQQRQQHTKSAKTIRLTLSSTASAFPNSILYTELTTRNMQTTSKAFLQRLGATGTGSTSALLRTSNASSGTQPVRSSPFLAARFLTTRTVGSTTNLQSPTATTAVPTTDISAINTPTSITDPVMTRRGFHTTAITSLAERKRRRRRGGGDTPSSDASREDGSSNSPQFTEHSAVTDPAEFQAVGQATLAKLEAAVEPMKAVNDPFKVSRSSDQTTVTIEVEAKWGSYHIELDHEERLLMFRSPVSGAHTYFYSKKTHEWIDTIDHHSFEGIFVRDLIRHCRGVPNL